MDINCTNTLQSLIGIPDLIDDVVTQITGPLRYQKYGPQFASPYQPEDKAEPLPAPKFILITGDEGSCKRSLASAIVNELRRGAMTKSADIYYKDRNVKFLRWDCVRTPRDMAMDEYFVDLLAKAQAKADGRDFTVLLIDRFEEACPTGGDEGRRPSQRRLVQKFPLEVQQLPEGVALIIGISCYPEEVEQSIKNLADFCYEIPRYDEKIKREIIRQYIDEEYAEISEENLQLIMSRLGWRSAKRLKEIVTKTLGYTRTRVQRLGLDNGNLTRVRIERQDLNWRIPPARNGDGGGGDGDAQQNQNPQWGDFLEEVREVILPMVGPRRQAGVGPAPNLQGGGVAQQQQPQAGMARGQAAAAGQPAQPRVQVVFGVPAGQQQQQPQQPQAQVQAGVGVGRGAGQQLPVVNPVGQLFQNIIGQLQNLNPQELARIPRAVHLEAGDGPAQQLQQAQQNAAVAAAAAAGNQGQGQGNVQEFVFGFPLLDDELRQAIRNQLAQNENDMDSDEEEEGDEVEEEEMEEEEEEEDEGMDEEDEGIAEEEADEEMEN